MCRKLRELRNSQKQNPGATNAKSNETQQAAAAHPKKSTSDHPPTPSIIRQFYQVRLNPDLR